jgi:hypothetical protein
MEECTRYTYSIDIYMTNIPDKLNRRWEDSSSYANSDSFLQRDPLESTFQACIHANADALSQNPGAHGKSNPSLQNGAETSGTDRTVSTSSANDESKTSR